MSPRGSVSTRGSTTPYSRRSANQPKSSRQQFSACGACRMRRVRCDLKDLPIGFVGPHPACSNCKERGIKCVDEFADMKAVKLLRRGRRLQQVEAIYGKVSDQDGNSSSSSLPSKSTTTIPNLQSEFFASPFWRWFSLQRPILDSRDFPVRFQNHCKGTRPLADEGGLIAMLLVTWAASFGLDERGLPESESDHSTPADSPEGSTSYYSESKFSPPSNRQTQCKIKTENYVREVLELVDYYGVLRRPSWDGIQALLLLLPLMEEAQPLERLVIYEATMSHIQALCVLAVSGTSTFEDAAVRTRIFYYAYTQEGIMIGIRGGRFVLNRDDLDSFQRTLPSDNFDIAGTTSPPSPSSVKHAPSVGSHAPPDSANFSSHEASAHNAYIHLMHSSRIPLEISHVCRQIHSVLTGTKATRRAEEHGVVDAHGMREIWRNLDRCWQELESRKRAPVESESLAQRFEVDQYLSAWQIFIFECHNVIREALKHFLSMPTAQSIYQDAPSRPSSHSSNSSPYLTPRHLHGTATRKCIALLPRVIHIIRIHFPREHGGFPSIFRWDAGLVRDGCFFAGYLAASVDGEIIGSPEDGGPDNISSHLTVDEGVTVCLTALSTMRWGFSKSEEREETIRMIWENHKVRRQEQARHIPLYDTDCPQTLAMSDSQMHIRLSPGPQTGLQIAPSGDRPMLPPLNAFSSQRRVDSAPSTACSSDDRGLNSWPQNYTPPGTATSITSAGTGTGLSRRNSPVFADMTSFKPTGGDMFYHGAGDLEQFTYNAPLSGPPVRDPSGMGSSVPQSHALAAGPSASYMAAGTFTGSNSVVNTHADYHSCPQFGEECSGAYH